MKTQKSGAENTGFAGASEEENRVSGESLKLQNGHNVQETGSHCHEGKTGPIIDYAARRKLIIACILCLVFMIGEIVGGFLAHSLAIVSDAAHILTDLASFLISLVAIYLAARPASKKLSFGWARAEILGALISILLLWVLTGVLVYMGVERIIYDTYEINATIMLITASCGVVFNLILGLSLHQHSHIGHRHDEEDHDTSDSDTSGTSTPTDRLVENGASYGTLPLETRSANLSKKSDKEHHKKRHSNLNVKAAFIHVLGDLIQSIGVLVAAIIIFFKPEWKMADPICTFLFSVLVLLTTISILWDIGRVLMEGTPKGIAMDQLRASFIEIDGVCELHDLRVWSLSLSKTALSVHLAVRPGTDPVQVLKEATAKVQREFNIADTTIQVEMFVDAMVDCTMCKDLVD